MLWTRTQESNRVSIKLEAVFKMVSIGRYMEAVSNKMEIIRTRTRDSLYGKYSIGRSSEWN